MVGHRVGKIDWWQSFRLDAGASSFISLKHKASFPFMPQLFWGTYLGLPTMRGLIIILRGGVGMGYFCIELQCASLGWGAIFLFCEIMTFRISWTCVYLLHCIRLVTSCKTFAGSSIVEIRQWWGFTLSHTGFDMIFLAPMLLVLAEANLLGITSFLAATATC